MHKMTNTHIYRDKHERAKIFHTWVCIHIHTLKQTHVLGALQLRECVINATMLNTMLCILFITFTLTLIKKSL